MSENFYHFSQGDLIAFSKGMLGGNKRWSTELWAFPDVLRVSLETETANYDGLYIAQNLSEGEKEVLMKRKSDHFKDMLIPTIRRVVHFVKATAEDSENVLNGYGYDPGDFPRSQGDIVALGENMVKGDDESQGKPWALTPERKQELVDAVNTAQSLMLQCQIAFGEQQETTQTQDESRARLEKILARCREWLYSNVPQARHDEILEFYGLKPLKDTPHKPHEPFPAPGMLMYDQFRNEFSWEKVKNATGYELEIFDKSTQEKITIEIAENHKRHELAKGDYAIKVRAVKEASEPVYSKWSGDVLFTVKPAPGQFKYNPGLKKLSWDSVAGANTYELQKEGSFDPVYLGADTEFVLDLPAGQYKFRVRGGDDMANWWSEWTEWLSVTV